MVPVERLLLFRKVSLLRKGENGGQCGTSRDSVLCLICETTRRCSQGPISEICTIYIQNRVCIATYLFSYVFFYRQIALIHDIYLHNNLK